MERIISRTSPERILRTGIAAVLVVGYSGWSLWDGSIAYPRSNVATAWREKLGLPAVGKLPDPNPRVTMNEAEAVVVGDKEASLAERFGEPGFQDAARRIYFGPAGYLVVQVEGGKVSASTWTNGPQHTSADLAFQKLVGAVLAPVGLGLILYLLRIVAFRVMLDERGLQIGRRGSIAFESMVELQAVGSPERGLYELTWKEKGKSRRFRFDSYTLREADAIARTIRERKGLADA